MRHFLICFSLGIFLCLSQAVFSEEWVSDAVYKFNVYFPDPNLPPAKRELTEKGVRYVEESKDRIEWITDREDLEHWQTGYMGVKYSVEIIEHSKSTSIQQYTKKNGLLGDYTYTSQGLYSFQYSITYDQVGIPLLFSTKTDYLKKGKVIDVGDYFIHLTVEGYRPGPYFDPKEKLIRAVIAPRLFTDEFLNSFESWIH